MPHVTDWLTSYLTPWSRVILEKLRVTQLVKKYPACYRTQRFIIVFTIAWHWSLSLDRWFQSTPSHLISITSILKLSSQLHLCLQSGLFPSGSSTNISHFSSLTCMSQCPAHHILNLITIYVIYIFKFSNRNCFFKPKYTLYFWVHTIYLSVEWESRWGIFLMHFAHPTIKKAGGG